MGTGCSSADAWCRRRVRSGRLRSTEMSCPVLALNFSSSSRSSSRDAMNRILHNFPSTQFPERNATRSPASSFLEKAGILCSLPALLDHSHACSGVVTAVARSVCEGYWTAHCRLHCRVCVCVCVCRHTMPCRPMLCYAIVISCGVRVRRFSQAVRSDLVMARGALSYPHRNLYSTVGVTKRMYPSRRNRRGHAHDDCPHELLWTQTRTHARRDERKKQPRCLTGPPSPSKIRRSASATHARPLPGVRRALFTSICSWETICLTTSKSWQRPYDRVLPGSRGHGEQRACGSMSAVCHRR